MGKLIYSAICSLDGYVEDSRGEFGWAAPNDEVMGFVNDLERPIGTYLYGRRMYETMLYWETADSIPGLSPNAREFKEIWLAADKVVYSRTMTSTSSRRTCIEQEFDFQAVERLKRAAESDLTVGGPDLAAQAIKAGLVDEIQMLLVPVVVGGGKRSLPKGIHLDLAQLETSRFSGGVVFLRYGVRYVGSG